MAGQNLYLDGPTARAVREDAERAETSGATILDRLVAEHLPGLLERCLTDRGEDARKVYARPETLRDLEVASSATGHPISHLVRRLVEDHRGEVVARLTGKGE